MCGKGIFETRVLCSKKIPDAIIANYRNVEHDDHEAGTTNTTLLFSLCGLRVSIVCVVFQLFHDARRNDENDPAWFVAHLLLRTTAQDSERTNNFYFRCRNFSPMKVCITNLTL